MSRGVVIQTGLPFESWFMTQPLVRQLAHVCLFSKDLDATAAFYTGVLGLPRKFDFMRDDRVVGFYLDLGGRTFIEVFERSAVNFHDTQNIGHLCLEVHDLDDTIAQLRKKGVVVSDKKTGGDCSWQAWTADPDGVKIEFHQYNDQSRQFAGGNVIYPSSPAPAKK